MDGQGRVIYALCPAKIPAERAFAWAKGVLGELQPEQVIMQTSLPVGDFTLSCPSSSASMLLTTDKTQAAEFKGHDSEEEVAARQFAVSTSAAAGNKVDQVLPELPTGNLVSGVAAAVMSRLQASIQLTLRPCKRTSSAKSLVNQMQAQGVPATLLVSVQGSGMPGLDTLKSLAGALQACLAAAGEDPAPRL